MKPDVSGEGGGGIETPPFVHILSHMNPVYTIAFCLFIIYFNIITIYTSRLSWWYVPVTFSYQKPIYI